MSKKVVHGVIAIPRESGAFYASYSICGRWVERNDSLVTRDKDEVTCMRCLGSNKWHAFANQGQPIERP